MVKTCDDKYLSKGGNKMKNIKKTGILALVLALALGALTACGGGSSEDKTIKVAASPTPHAEILEAASAALEAEGWTLEVQEFEDYVQPNVATTDGDVDANYFQHVPYLEDYNAENGTDLTAVANMHYEKMAVYSETKKSLDELADGDKIGVPNDTTNEARALKVLADNGIITLKEGVGSEATKTDIVDNPKNVEIVELEAASIPASLPDLAFGVINANYAIQADIMDKLVVAEGTDQEQEDTYVNVIVVSAENAESEKTQALVNALHSDEVKKFIEETYNGAVVAKF